MSTVTVYRYKILEPDVVERRLARRWGTREAIAGLKDMAEILEATAAQVDESVLNPGGFTPLDFDPKSS